MLRRSIVATWRTLNVVFLSPHFPPNFHRFCVGLREVGATVLGIGDTPFEELRPELCDALHDYYRVDDLHRYDDLVRAIADGSLVALEVNMRPPGGPTVDMWNYANDFGFYREWANIVVHGKFESTITCSYHCLFAGRKQGKAYGSGGQPLLAFPSFGGRVWDLEGFGMVEALAPMIAAGRVRLIAADGIDHQSWADHGKPIAERARRHGDFDRYVAEELQPFIGEMTGRDGVWATGCNMGAYHAANAFFRHPDLEWAWWRRMLPYFLEQLEVC